jgi:hypothetical protein
MYFESLLNTRAKDNDVFNCRPQKKSPTLIRIGRKGSERYINHPKNAMARTRYSFACRIRIFPIETPHSSPVRAPDCGDRHRDGGYGFLYSRGMGKARLSAQVRFMALGKPPQPYPLSLGSTSSLSVPGTDAGSFGVCR